MDTLFVDAETDGLYGGFLSVASIVVDEAGRETDIFYGMVKDPESKIHSEWVRENVLPYLGKPVRSEDDLYDSERDLIEAFYTFYMSHSDCEVIADVPCPVESRLFIKAVEYDLKNREFKAPFPLMDLSSMLYANGITPHTERRSIVDCSDLVLHNALDDVRMSIRVWKKLKGKAYDER